MTEYVGSRVGDYQVVEQIGSGGMGSVYRAEHMYLGRNYALKVLDDEWAQDPDLVARFYHEACTMAELRHPHIVQVQHMGSLGGPCFLVMDYIAGPNGKPSSLHEYLRDCPQGRLDEDQARTWAIQIAEALAYAHNRGVVHRDLKPANLLIDADGNVRLTDFGLAKVIGEEFVPLQQHRTVSDPRGNVRELLDTAARPDESGRTSGGSAILGTYDYMAPEQRGEGPAHVDERTDIYAFGVLLYRMLTGRRPVPLAKRVSQAVPGLCRRWDALVARCLAEAPDARYRSAGELLKDLRNLVGRSRLPAIARWAAVFMLTLTLAVPLLRFAQAHLGHGSPLAIEATASAGVDRRTSGPAADPTIAAPRSPAEAAAHPAGALFNGSRDDPGTAPAQQPAQTQPQTTLAKAVDAMRKDLADGNQQVAALVERVGKLEGLQAGAAQLRAGRDAHLRELEAKISKLGDRSAGAALAQGDAGRQLRQTQMRLAGLEKTVEALGKDATSRDGAAEELARKIRELERTDAEAARRYAEVVRFYEGLSSGAASSTKQVQIAQQLRQTQEQVADLVEAVQALRDEATGYEADLGALTKRIRQLADARQGGKKQAELAAQLQGAQDQVSQLKSLIQAWQLKDAQVQMERLERLIRLLGGERRPPSPAPPAAGIFGGSARRTGDWVIDPKEYK